MSSRRLVLRFFLSLVVALCAITWPASKPLENQVSAAPETRLGGLDRFETAALVANEVSLQGMAGSTVILASGLNYPDALVGGAWTDPSVILLTRLNQLPESTLEILKTSSVTSVRIVGGTAVVSSQVEAEVRKLGLTVERFSGATRYETSLEVFRSVTATTKASSLWLASGYSFADQLVAVAAARRVGGAVAIVPPWKELSTSTTQILKSGLLANATIHIVDGSRALEKVSISGYTAERHYNDPFANSVDLQAGPSARTYVASGENWPDALAASRLIDSHSRLILSRPSCSPSSVLGEITSSLSSGKATLIGGPVAIGNVQTLGTNCPLGETPVSIARDECRLVQGAQPPNSVESRFSTAFPFNAENVNPVGEMKILVIPVDWSNHQGSTENLTREFAQVHTFTNLFTTMSEGRLTFRTTPLDKWHRLSEPIENYPQEWSSDFNTKVVQEAVDLVDPEVNFSQVDLIILVFPDNPPIPTTKHLEYGFASMQNFNDYPYSSPVRGGSPDPRAIFSDEGFVRNYVGGANYFDHPLRPLWTYLAHEVGHVISLPDWYIREANLGNDFLPGLNFAVGPMSSWDLMSTQDGPSRTYSSWTRWLLGWLGDDRVVCLDLSTLGTSSDFEVELLPLDLYAPGTKTVMIKVSDHEAVVVESRRAVFPDHDLIFWEQVGRKPYGILAYLVDSEKGNSRGTLAVVPPIGQGIGGPQLTGRMDRRQIDGLGNLGAKVRVANLEIELVQTGYTDKVRITTLPS